jgi:S1-C subfamily serine protease
MKISNACQPIKTNYSAKMKVKQFVWSLFLMTFVPAAVMAQTPVNSGQTNAPAHSSHPQQINGGKIITRGGKTYKGVVVQKAAPDGLVIGYTMTDGGMGITKLKFKDLSDILQQQFGYNPTNAAAFDKEQKHAEGEWQAQWSADDEKARSKRNEQDITDAEANISAQGGAVGTGFFITDNGYLLTCFHVVDNATSIQVGTKHGLFDAELVQSDTDNDIALLKVNGTFSSLPLVSSNGVNFGEAVFTIGYPDPVLQGWQPKLTRGEISSLSGIQDDTNYYQISVPIQPGNSGGALLDEHGNVVGIVARTLKQSAALAETGSLAQNVNYAIKSSGIRTFLDSVPAGWPFKLKPEYPSLDRKFGDVVQTSQDAVALVLVQ